MIDAVGHLATTRLSRRVVLRTSSAVAALSLLGSGPRRTAAWDGATGPGAQEWTEADHLDPADPAAAGDEGWQHFAADFPFSAVAPHWSGEEPPGAMVELILSADGVLWTEPVVVGEATHRGGRPDRDNRRFGDLVAADGARFVRYRTYDAGGGRTPLRGFALTAIDAAPGPLVAGISSDSPVPSPGAPPIVARAAWGADEALRFAEGREIWPAEYRTVEHVVVHHTDTANFQDPLVAIRSVYYYHAVVRGWGDIGYNYLVDYLGNVYEGRFGGEQVVGGHALGYNEGTSGIGLIGRFDAEAPTPEMRGGLVAIAAWAARALDPLGQAPFRDIPSLPTICAHRDVNPTACPGELLYADLQAIREEAAALLAGTGGAAPAARAAEAAPAFLSGDPVATTVDNAELREGPGLTYPLIGLMSLGEPLTVTDGPTSADGLAWYAVQGSTLAGWTPADALAASVGGPAVTAPPASLAPGTPARVVAGDLNLRAAPGLAVAPVAVLPDGSLVTILSGPTEADGIAWYEVDAGALGVGWCSGEFLAPA